LIGAVLDALRAGVEARVLLRYFEFWTARLHGIFPGLESCDGCGRAFGAAGARLATGGESAMCRSCARTAGGRTIPLSRAALGVIEAFRTSAPSAFANVVYPSTALREVESAAVEALVSFIGRDIRSASYLRQVVAETPQ
jgi:recombinational DNA repair protein (RecF pathway)